jgi:hypothetical protein
MTDEHPSGGETAEHLHQDAADAEREQGLLRDDDHPAVDDPEPERAEHPAEGR